MVSENILTSVKVASGLENKYVEGRIYCADFKTAKQVVRWLLKLKRTYDHSNNLGECVNKA